MAKKRLIGVVTVRRDLAVQSFGYRRYLPLGDPVVLVENLDRWGADEILVQSIDRSRDGAGPNWNLLDRLANLETKTPLIYCGGIRSVQDGIEVVRRGADRIAIDSLLRTDPAAIPELAEHLGAQAVIAALPLSWSSEGLAWLDYRTDQSEPLPDAVVEMMRTRTISEALLIDWQHEGSAEAFDTRIIEEFPMDEERVIGFGGISSVRLARQLLTVPKVSAVAVGNSLNYREHAVQDFKAGLVAVGTRPPGYSSTDGLVRSG